MASLVLRRRPAAEELTGGQLSAVATFVGNVFPTVTPSTTKAIHLVKDSEGVTRCSIEFEDEYTLAEAKTLAEGGEKFLIVDYNP